MNLPVYIAKRYLFAKKSHHIINIISAISVGGITIGTAALIIVLSVFNGFENMVVTMFNSFNPDLKVTPAVGKTFNEQKLDEKKILNLQGISCVTKVIEENALVKYLDKQYICTIKGVSDDFYRTSRLDSMIVHGDAILERGEQNFAIVGMGVSYNLGLNLNDYENPLSVYVPRRFEGNRINPVEAFNHMLIQCSGVFSVQQEYDQKFIIVPLRFAAELLESEHQLSALEIKVDPAARPDRVQKQLQSLLGDDYTVKNKYQQEEVLFKIMKSEKLAVFMILSFILLIATFNVIGSLSMLIIDKRKDIAVLKSLGAGNQTVRNIFFTEGMMISLSGALLGLFLGGVVCWVQQTFGIITVSAGDTFVMDAYPVRILALDFVYVFLIVCVIGFIAAWYPVKYISKKHLEQRLS
ncbi:MAG TPA: FtsX-like permease family protein [Bacteroidales bacterium]|nr:FtsX-like permease family protein [Bacteroidales bacterium]